MSDQGPEYPTYPGEGSSEGSQPGSAPPPPTGTAAVPSQPSSIATAVRLMYAGAALSLLSVLASFFMLDTMKDAVEESVLESNPDASQSTIDAFYTGSIVFGVAIGLISVVLWLWMAWKNGQGRSWARIVATVFGSLNVILTLLSFTQPGVTGVTATINIVSMVLAIVILVLLWRRESSLYYEAVTESQRLR